MDTVLISVLIVGFLISGLIGLYNRHHSLSLIVKYSKSRVWLIGLFIFIFLFFVIDLVLEFGLDTEVLKNPREGVWSKTISQYITLGTFLAAFAAWFSTLYRDWKESLPKRLSIYFSHKNKIVMQCNYSHLSGEADIRALAQQIGGRQMVSGNLSFYAPKTHWKELDIVYIKNNEIEEIKEHLEFPFRHYVALFELEELPDLLKEQPHSYIWNPPFNIELNKRDQEIKDKYEILLEKTKDKEQKKKIESPKLLKYNETKGFCKNNSESKIKNFETHFWQKIKDNNGYCSNDDFKADEQK